MIEQSKQVNKLIYFASSRVRGLVIYLVTLAIVSLIVVGMGSTFQNSLIVYFQKEKPDSIQVFFPVDGKYSEENSVRADFFDNVKNGIKIVLPQNLFEHVRIDPATEAGDVIIEKMELRNLFSTETLMPNDLVVLAKPIQMIDKFEITPNGLLLHSTGNDPFFELQINRSSVLFEYIILGIISIFLSFIIFLLIAFRKKLYKICVALGLEKSTSDKMRKIYLFAIPLLVSLGIVFIFYPGFMTYDTLHALRGARNGVTDSMWPPMVSYVWRAVDLVSLNPSAMHFLQVFLLLGSIFYIIYFFTKKIWCATLFLVIYLSIPVVLGTVAVIWKDVLMASFFMSSFAIVVYMETVANKWRFILLSLLSVFLIFLGVCSRHNAIAGAVPLLFYLAFVVCSRKYNCPMHLWLSIFLLGSVLIGSLYYTKTILDNYSLPSFTKLNSSTSTFLESVRVLDVAGASVCVHSNLFSEMAPNLSVAEIESLYDPKHINLSAGLLGKVGTDNRINKIWLNVAIHHPICFFNNKFQLTKYMIGANEGAQFLITAPSVDENEYGYSLPESSFRDSVVTYIIKASNWFFFRPWFIYLISILAFIYMIRIKALAVSYLTMFLSAILYFVGLIMTGNAADARLLFYSTTVFLVFVFITIFVSIIRFKQKP